MQTNQHIVLVAPTSQASFRVEVAILAAQEFRQLDAAATIEALRLAAYYLETGNSINAETAAAEALARIHYYMRRA